MTRYHVTMTHNGRADESYREAETPLEAAQQASRGVYSGLHVYPAGDGEDLYGHYERFSARVPGSAVALSIRVATR